MKPQGASAFTSPEIGVERVRNEFHSYLVSYSALQFYCLNVNEVVIHVKYNVT